MNAESSTDHKDSSSTACGHRPCGLGLLLKLIAVGLFLGSYSSAGLLWFYYHLGWSGGQVWPVQAVSLLFRYAVVPTLFTTLFLGVVLFLHQPRHYLRHRWMIAKLLLLALLVAVHLPARRTFLRIKEAVVHEGGVTDAAQFASWCRWFSVLLIVGAVLALTLLKLPVVG